MVCVGSTSFQAFSKGDLDVGPRDECEWNGHENEDSVLSGAGDANAGRGGGGGAGIDGAAHVHAAFPLPLHFLVCGWNGIVMARRAVQTIWTSPATRTKRA